jgi:hypothetical protein
MSNKSFKLLLIIFLTSIGLPLLIKMNESIGQINEGLNLIIRPLILFIVFEPFVFIWKKYVRKKEVISPMSKEFINDAIESLFAYWIILTILFFPNYGIWYLILSNS